MSAIFIPDTQAIIFDMDGVLVDSEHWWPKVKGDFFARAAKRHWDSIDERRIIGTSLRDIHFLLQKEYGATMNYENFEAAYTVMAREVYGKKVRLMSCVREVLEHFSSRKTALALASSSLHSWIAMVMERFDLQRYFAVLVSAEDVGSRGKPRPDIYLHTARLLNITPNKCVVIEDSTYGVASAKAAGMRVVGVKSDPYLGQDISGADAVISDLCALLN